MFDAERALCARPVVRTVRIDIERTRNAGGAESAIERKCVGQRDRVGGTRREQDRRRELELADAAIAERPGREARDCIEWAPTLWALRGSDGQTTAERPADNADSRAVD